MPCGIAPFCIMMKYTDVIWDFNGTVLSDMQAGIDAVNEMLAARDLAVIADMESYRRAFCFPVETYYRNLGFDFEKEDYKTVLAPLWVSLYNKYTIAIYILHCMGLCDIRHSF